MQKNSFDSELCKWVFPAPSLGTHLEQNFSKVLSTESGVVG